MPMFHGVLIKNTKLTDDPCQMFLHCELGELLVEDKKFSKLDGKKTYPIYFTVEKLKVSLLAHCKYDKVVSLVVAAELQQWIFQDKSKSQKQTPSNNDSSDLFSESAQSDDNSEQAGRNEPDAQLFGELWPLGERVDLEPTNDRDLLRKQTDRLRALGYEFRQEQQCWYDPRSEII